MNKLLINQPGGFPLRSDDFLFLDEAIRESFYAICKAFDGSFKLHGCEITTSNDVAYSTEGYIAIDGEILHVVPCQADIEYIPGIGQVLPGFQLDTLDTDNRTFFDGNNRYTQQIRKAKLVSFSQLNPQLPVLSANADYIHNIIKRKLSEIPEENWREIGTPGNPMFENDVQNTPGYSTAAFRKLSNGLIALKGCMITNGNSQLFQLPTGYRPQQTLTLKAIGSSLPDNPVQPVFLTISPNTGMISIEPVVNFISIDGIFF